MGFFLGLLFGFIAGGFLTRRSVWAVINGKAKFAVVPKPEEKGASHATHSPSEKDSAKA